jgi:hypothetical protein
MKIIVFANGLDHPTAVEMAAALAQAGVMFASTTERPVGPISAQPCVCALYDNGVVAQSWADLPLDTAAISTAAQQAGTPPVVAPVLLWDEFDFRKRFTRDERKAIMAAVKVNEDVADFEAMLQAAGRTGTMIKANDALLNEAMALLESAGLIGQGRAAEILAA